MKIGNAVILSVLVSFGCSKLRSNDHTSTSSDRSSIVSKPSSEPVGEEKPTAFSELMKKKSLKSAIETAKPYMTDTTDDMSPGAAAFGIWSASNLKWVELNTLPKTKFSLVMKDSDEERGKLLCTKGVIIEIYTDKSIGTKIYNGGVYGNDRNVYRFISVGSTGELVQKSIASICGVVIGKQSYKNSVGGVAHAVFIVGMFDLPENK